MRRTLSILSFAVTLPACVTADSAPVIVQALPSPAGPGSAEPSLTADASGRVYMTWLEPAGDSGTALRFAVLAGDEWSAARTIAASRTMLANWADFPTLVAGSGGRLAAHWMQRTPGNSHAYDLYLAQSFDGGQSWGAPVRPHRDGLPAEHGFAALYAAGADAFGAAWLDGRKHATHEAAGGGASAPPAEMMLLHTTLRRDGSLGSEDVLDPRICDCCQTSLAMAAAGPVLVYRDRSPDEIRDISIIRNVAGRWTAPRRVHADQWHVTFCPVNGPSVAARNDLVSVVWFTAARDTSKVLVAFSTDGGATFGAPLRVDEGAPLGRVDVELAPDGSALVTWIERGPRGDAAVRVRRVTPRGAVGPAITVGPISPSRPSGFPRIAAQGAELVAVWTTTDRPSSLHIVRVLTDRLR